MLWTIIVILFILLAPRRFHRSLLNVGNLDSSVAGDRRHYSYLQPDHRPSRSLATDQSGGPSVLGHRTARMGPYPRRPLHRSTTGPKKYDYEL